MLRLAIGAGCRSIISFGVGGGLAPDLIPGDCVVASAIIDYPSVRPTDLADAHGLALAAVRVIIDPAYRAVPPAALLAMAPGGSADVSAMLREILGRPSQVSPLMRLAADAISARAALVRLRRALWPSFSWE